ncbi:Sulfatase [Hexamita inflata]|uniref:Sulfatase n=1 Tax=Hexamita inflata TaxID=28002 RepID=A0AA86PA49_9EUKA|nr:Sulfatase [Hexamita inflata]
MPTVVVNLLILLYYFVVFVITILDGEICREMQSNVTVDHLLAYNFGNQKLYKQTLIEQGQIVGNGGIQVLLDAIKGNYIHWSILLSVYGLIAILSLYLIISHRNLLKFSFQRINLQQIQHQKLMKNIQIEYIEEDQYIYTENSIQNKEINGKTKKIKQQLIFCEHQLWNKYVGVISIVTVVDIVLLSVFISNRNVTIPLNRFVPAQWWLYQSGRITQMNPIDYQTSLQALHLEYEQSSKYIIDVRANPIYPLITGTYAQFCSYNYDICKQALQPVYNNILNSLQNTAQNIIIKSSEVISPPNLLFIIVESFSHVPKYLEESFINNQANYQGSAYSKQYLPSIKSWAEYGVTFLGTASFGLPTIYGWHSLVTSEKPLSRGINMINSVHNNVESIFSSVKNIGYYNSYFSPSPFDFDGKNNWVFIDDWFDEVHYYVPTDDQKVMLNIENVTQNAWVADRVLQREAILSITVQFISNCKLTLERASQLYSSEVNCSVALAHSILSLKQSQMGSNLPKLNQPLFITFMNVDTHTPFTGFDSLHQYDQFKTNDSYSTMLRSADHYIGKLISYIHQIDNNTLLALTGDHGAREHPVYSKNQPLTNETRFDPLCVHKTNGNDNMFTTSSVIAFLNNFSLPYQNKTIFTQNDHDDFITTILHLIFSANRAQLPPTSRNGNNLFSAYQNKLSVSSTHNVFEFRRGTEILRGNRLSLKNAIHIQGNYPTCVIQLSSQKQKQDLFTEGMKRIRLFNYLTERNRVWNKGFEDGDCVVDPVTLEGKRCGLPE